MSGKDIGTHLRIKKSYSKILEQALELGISSCQFFFMPKSNDKYVRLTPKDKEQFIALRKEYSFNLYAHTSYWINSATGNKVSSTISKNLLKKELSIASKLGIKYLVLHAGSAKCFEKNQNDPMSRTAGINALAKILISALKTEDKVTLLVENTAHAGKTVCSDLQDFIILKSILKERNDSIKFCFDTSHAFAYGYNLEATDSFVDLLDHTMGIKNIELIHLNDSAKPCGSRIDQHEIPGRGLIGKKILKKLINHPKLKHIPMIIEPPTMSKEKWNDPTLGIKEVINKVRQWRC